MKLDKAIKRDRKINRRKNGMRRDGDSVKVIQSIQIKRKEKQKAKEKRQQEKLEELLLED